MNVYDFDKTIYDGDSTVNFYKYSIIQSPKVLFNLPRTVWYGLKFKLGICDKTFFKEQFYRFLRYIKDPEALVEKFWLKNEQKIKRWYLDRKREDDIIISASPEFLLKPICSKLGITMMASVVDIHTGAYTGTNCDGKEKVRRLYQAFPDAVIDDFYSDSHSDDPLAHIAESAYMVDGNRIFPWN